MPGPCAPKVQGQGQNEPWHQDSLCSLVSGTATLIQPALAAGGYAITATYNGSATFAGSASPSAWSQTVNAAGSTTSAVLAATTNINPSTYGQSLTYTATVANAAGTGPLPTGTVTFFNGATSLGTRSLVSGTARLTLPNLAAGSYAITAAYNGSADFTGSSSASTVSQTVAPASTSTNVTASPSPATTGQSVTLIATVMNTADTGAIPTGTVTFKDVVNGVTTTLGTRSLERGGNVHDFDSSPCLTSVVVSPCGPSPDF